MRGYLKIGVAVGSLLALPLACGTEFQACEGAECDTTTGGGTAGTTGLGGTEGGGTGGTVATDATSTMGQGGTSGTTSSTTGGGEGGDPGVGGAAGAGGSPPMCEGELLPGDDACVVDEEYGVFVAPGGDDTTGDGTREAPFATLRKAADAASEAGKRVYACATAGDYVAALSLAEAHDGLELYGSFDCGDWSYDGDLRANVAPEAGVALSVSEIETSLELDGFTFESADATTPGGSSVAAEIRASSGVVLRNVALRAGAGATGAPGVTVNFTYPEKSELDGVPGTEEDEGVMPFVPCPAGDTTRGGPGGSIAPGDGSDGRPNHEGPGGEGGVTSAGCGSGGTGMDGADGPAGTEGPGATTLGALDSGSWAPAAGSDGGHGLPGQGGGGGAGAANGGGGSGGAGGCGGAAGKAGGGGGASIALLLVDSEVALVDAEVTAGDAGDGGAGSGGQEGQQEFGDFGAGDPAGCPGGRGGLGGNGGAGGGGAGGISVGILVQGTSATLTNTDVLAGSEGFAGDGPGASNDGVLGIAQPELNVADL